MTYGLPDSMLVGTTQRVTATLRKERRRNSSPIMDELVYAGALAVDDFFFGWIKRLIKRPKRQTYDAPKNMRFTARQVRKQQKRFGL